MQADPPGTGAASAEPAGVDLGIEGLVDAQEIGRGGFGIVYRARQPQFNRTVAVKLLTLPVVDEQARRRFERELTTMGSLSGHANIVPVFSAGFTRGGHPYLVMEDMGGGSLADMLQRRGPLPWQEVVAIGAALADALEAAHQAGVLHRDVKPENVLISKYGTYKLGDFGIARLDGGENRSTTLQLSVLHAPPEVLNGLQPSVASDVYALGSTLHTLLAGRAPFWREGEGSLYAAVTRVHTEPVPDLRLHDVPDPVCRVLEHAMQKAPEDRPVSAAAFGEELREAARQATAPGVQLPAAIDAERTVAIDAAAGGIPWTAAQPHPAVASSVSGALPAPLPPPRPPAQTGTQVPGPPPGQRIYGGSPAQPPQHPYPAQVPYPASQPLGFPNTYGPPGAWPQGSASRRRSVLPWVLVAIVVLTAMTGGGVYLATHRSSGSAATSGSTTPSSSASPSDTVTTTLTQAQLDSVILGDSSLPSGYRQVTASGTISEYAFCNQATDTSRVRASSQREWNATDASGTLLGDIRIDVDSLGPGGATASLAQQASHFDSCGGTWDSTDSSGAQFHITGQKGGNDASAADEGQSFLLDYSSSALTVTPTQGVEEARAGDVLVIVSELVRTGQPQVAGGLLQEQIASVLAAQGR